MGVRHCNGGARDRRCLAHYRRSSRADTRPHLYRADILRRGHGRARQHDRHARRRHHPRRRRNDRPDPVRRLLGAGHFVRVAARGSLRPAARPVRQAIMSRSGIRFWIGVTLFLAATLLMPQVIGFSIATIALPIVIETSITNWRYVGGAAGIQMQRPVVMEPFNNYVQMLFFIQALLVVLAVAVSRYIQNSWIGRGLQALKDDELAAECTGVPTLRLKLLACVISGALMCAAGAPAAMYLQYADPSSAFNLNYSVSVLAMSLIGGTAHWAGPIVGAILLGTTQQLLTVTISSEVNVLVLGIMLVLFVVSAPKGIVGLLRPRYRLRAGGKA